jgi:hypothetical protein
LIAERTRTGAEFTLKRHYAIFSSRFSGDAGTVFDGLGGACRLSHLYGWFCPMLKNYNAIIRLTSGLCFRGSGTLIISPYFSVLNVD